MNKVEYKICKDGIWDTTVPGISFDENGISNYSRIQKNLMSAFPLGSDGENEWKDIISKIKKHKNKSGYDSIIGISGGTDSSYLLHLAKEYGLNPLAVNLDNGWNSVIAVSNIQKMTSALNIDLETYVIEYEEIKDIMRVYMLAGLPWIDVPTDLAIHSVLYKIANQEKIKFILLGSDFRSEGKQPMEWTYSDSKQLKYLHKKFGKIKLNTYPIMSIFKLAYLSLFKGIRSIPVYSYIPYQKKMAREYLIKNYGWQYYGEHHHENIFTKFAIGYWMYDKFNIDKRIITYSAQILSGEITREEALKKVEFPPYDQNDIEHDKEYVIKKLGFTKDEFNKLWNAENKNYKSYPSNITLIEKYSKILLPVVSKILGVKPKMFFEMEERKI
jgi:N-acetyl sugar amidotransferase